MNWFNSLNPTLQAAIIASGVTFFGIVLKDVVIKLLIDIKKRKETSLEIFRKYSDPLLSASTSLLWRLNEIFFEKGRGSYLIGETPETTFDELRIVL